MKSSDRLTQLERFLEADPGDSFTRYALALEHIGSGSTERGVQLLRETIERDPAYVPAYQMLGQQYARMGEDEQARDVLERGIVAARAAGNAHAASEMQTELDIL
jgi:predicted Zn-dependent protease